MPRTEIALTSGIWTQLGVAGKMIVTIQFAGDRYVRFNDVASDTAASQYPTGDAYSNRQFEQTSETENTFVKAGGAGWIVIVDQ
tara:strand:+ start:4939 stop:5190 length:252 start_codon:yes stop_codon:yes gene_type:complete